MITRLSKVLAAGALQLVVACSGETGPVGPSTSPMSASRIAVDDGIDAGSDDATATVATESCPTIAAACREGTLKGVPARPAGSNDGVPCVPDWSKAHDAVAWCPTLPANAIIYLRAGCGSFDFAYFGSFAFYYDAASGALTGVGQGGGDGFWCIAGDASTATDNCADGGAITRIVCGAAGSSDQ
jgi:hypothetical protein